MQHLLKKVGWLFGLAWLLLALPALSQDKVTVSGYLKDKASGEGLIGATVTVKEMPATGTAANEYGYWSLTLPKGTYTFLFRYIGYETVELPVELSATRKLEIELAEAGTQLQEVEVTGRKEDEQVKSLEMSTMKISAAELKAIPALLGEVDLVKAVQLLPGVTTVGEGTSGFYVRGGGVDQNLIQLDEATVYNASHLMGFFSVFNADAIKDVQLYKGGIPAAYGGRLSSLLDIRMKEGNAKKFTGAGGIGLLSSRLTIEGPIQKDKSSFILSGRRTYADLFLKLSSNEEMRDNRLYFYDLNAKANFTLNQNNRLFVSGYFGRDVARTNDFGFDWGNATATIRWNHLFSDRLFTNTTLIYSDFDYALGSEAEESAFRWVSSIRDYSLKHDYTFFLNPENQLRFGIMATSHIFAPGEVKPGEKSYFNHIKLNATNGLEGAAYLSNEQKITPRLTVEYGLRYSVFSNVGKGQIFKYENDQPTSTEEIIDTVQFGRFEKIKTYGGLEPRIAANYSLTESSSLKLSYNRNRQYLHLISNSTAALPFDVWVPSSTYIKPGIADQVAAGYFRNFKDNTYEGSVEVYYKTMQNVVDYKDHANTFLNDHIETELLTGKGKAYGIEWLLRKQKGRFTGWLSYTLAKTDRTVPGINNGKAYASRYDRRHSLNLVSAYDLSQRVNVSANWTLATGGAVTMPVGKYEYGGVIVPYYSERNGFRLPAYHRLDLSLTLNQKPKDNRKFHSSWVFSVYNAYARHNAFSISFREKKERDEAHGGSYGTGQTEAIKTYMFGVIPAVTWNFHF